VPPVPLPESTQAEVWERWCRGEPLYLIARRLRQNILKVSALVAERGGCRPRGRGPRGPRYLSPAEREEISRGLAAGRSLRAIARQLGRAASSVSREVARNGGPQAYRAEAAERAARERARRPKSAKLWAEPRLRAVVEDCLARRPSPEQIAAFLRRTYPGDPVMYAAPETIYQSLFVQGRGALRRELTRCLRSGQAVRRPRAQRRQPAGRGRMRDMIMISERPAEVADRAVPGHWEGDLLMGTPPSAIGTLVERRSRYLMLFALPSGHDAQQVREALTVQILRLPRELRRSVTWDQGHEMAEHARFRVDTGIQVYFCDPRSPWQRGTGENTNGLLRQYFPRGRDLSEFSQLELNAVAAELNSRPRQTLGWLTPWEKLDEVVR
jgi:transposase, IS30 family